MGDLSPHFSTREFQSRDGAPLTPVRGNVLRLVAHLEVLRCNAGGMPLRIVSGHRSAAHNAAVGGARASRHLTGEAADIPQGYATVADAAAAGFTGIGEKNGYAVHVDLRPDPVRWSY